jgi:hypothetical protein
MPERTMRNSEPKRTSFFDLTLAETFLSAVIALFAIVQITTWLFSSSQVARDQSHIEFVSLLVNQAYADRDNPNNPLCIFYKEEEKTLIYVICDSQKPVAEDEYALTVGLPSNRLMIRRFYDGNGKGIMAIDRYEYSDNSELVRVNRVIFQKYLWAVKCAYVETNYDSGGVLSQSRFHGSCGADMVEIPAFPPMRSSGPPPIILFMPYR